MCSSYVPQRNNLQTVADLVSLCVCATSYQLTSLPSPLPLAPFLPLCCVPVWTAWRHLEGTLINLPVSNSNSSPGSQAKRNRKPKLGPTDNVCHVNYNDAVVTCRRGRDSSDLALLLLLFRLPAVPCLLFWLCSSISCFLYLLQVLLFCLLLLLSLFLLSTPFLSAHFSKYSSTLAFSSSFSCLFLCAAFLV